ncbi:hypothetical protein [Paraburkholderia caribensis]|uniref:hypothetical protein n=1 Tax=Paraburkholderia caribensis TaxID=75105 RepID=UPI000A97DFCF|nr:hypothetical protein [Paraburkholderia caribensis]
MFRSNGREEKRAHMYLGALAQLTQATYEAIALNVPHSTLRAEANIKALRANGIVGKHFPISAGFPVTLPGLLSSVSARILRSAPRSLPCTTLDFRADA